MARVLAFVLVIITIASQSDCAIIRAQDGQISIGRATGSTFGPGSFSVGEPGRSGPGGRGGRGGNIYDEPKPPSGFKRDSFEEYDHVNEGSSVVGFDHQIDYQNHPSVIGYSRGDDGRSIVIDKIIGGTFPDGSFSLGRREYRNQRRRSNRNSGFPGLQYPDQSQSENSYPRSTGSFSIGHGKDSYYGDGGQGADVVIGPISRPRQIPDDRKPHFNTVNTASQYPGGQYPAYGMGNRKIDATKNTVTYPDQLGYQSHFNQNEGKSPIFKSQNERAFYSFGNGKNSVYGDGGRGADVYGGNFLYPGQIELWGVDNVNQPGGNDPEKGYFKRFGSWLGGYLPF